ncbi:MAG: response regulator, partial [Planctomycetota bacterium]
MSDASKTILVVEDVPDERSFLTTMLEDAGFRVVEAADGPEALARIAEDRPDLVTLD